MPFTTVALNLTASLILDVLQVLELFPEGGFHGRQRFFEFYSNVSLLVRELPCGGLC